MAKQQAHLTKESLVVEADEMRELVAIGCFSQRIETVGAAACCALAIRQMQDGIRELRTGGTFGRRLR